MKDRVPVCFAVIMLLLICTSPNAESREWSRIGPPSPTVLQVLPDRKHPSILFVVTQGYLYRSEDGGKSWALQRLRGVTAAALDPNTSEFYLLTEHPGSLIYSIWLSKDLGRTYSLRNKSASIRRIIAIPGDKRAIFGFDGSESDLAVSKDRGKTWSALSNLPYALHNSLPGRSNCRADAYYFQDLAGSRSNRATLFATGYLYASCGPYDWLTINFLIKSNNHGQKWSLVEHRTIYDSEPSAPLYRFLVDPFFRDRLFAYGGRGIKLLTSAGWEKISNRSLSQLVSVPDHSNTLLALRQVSNYSHFSVPYVSSDEGHTWQKLNLNLHNTIRVLETLNDGKMGLLAGTEGQGLYYRSENSNWISANKGFLDANVRDVLSASDKLTYAIVSGVDCCSSIPFLFRREKSGNWTNLSFGYPPGLNETSNFTGFAVNPQNGENLVLIVNSTLFVSNNRGSSWTRYPPNGLSYPVFDPADPHVIYFAKENREYRSTNGGKTVNALPLKFNSTYHPLVVDPYNRNNLFFLDEETLYKSSDGGLTIRKITNGIHSSRPADFCLRDLVPLSQPNAFAMLSCTGYAYRSLDSGEHWTTIGDDLGFGQRIFAGVDQDNIYVLADRLMETKDGGNSWHNISQELGKEFSGRRPLAFVTGMANSSTHPILVSTTSGIFQEAQRDK